MNDELADIVKSFKSYVESDYAWGLDGYFMHLRPQDTILSDARKTYAPPSALSVKEIKKAPCSVNRQEGSKSQKLDELKKIAVECRECDLCKTRRNLVLGEGNIDARLMFVGEAPGMEEDLQGRPFVGKAGDLLNKIIEAMGLKRADVYIANCLKCRPPQNRAPLPTEIISCKHFLEDQINIIKPNVLCGLGRFATVSLLNIDKPISSLRGRFHEYEGIKFMPTFHPAYLLRNPADKKLCWQDMKKIMLELGVSAK